MVTQHLDGALYNAACFTKQDRPTTEKPHVLSMDELVKVHKQFRHPSKEKFIKRLRLSQVFKFSGSDVDKLYRECVPCRAAADKVPKPPVSGRLYERPNQQVNIDLCEMVLGGVKRSVFVAVDAFTGFSLREWLRAKLLQRRVQRFINM